MRTEHEAVAAALATKTNVPGSCQFQVRTWLDAPSAGDVDGDGAADAEDGWKSEPLSARHPDKRGRAGHPGAYLGGSHDNGHRVLFIGPGEVRSTDFDSVTKRYRAGSVGTGTVDEVGRAMGVTWVGWSDTIDGQAIPKDPPPKPLTKGWRVEKAEKLVKHAHSKPGTPRAKLLQQIADLLAKVPKR